MLLIFRQLVWLLLLRIHLSIHLVDCFLLQLKKALMIFVLLSELVCLVLELLQLQLISLLLRHVE